MCPRNYRGTDYNSGYPLTELSANDIAEILDPIKHQLQFVNFNGNLGDFSNAAQGKQSIDWLLANTSAEINVMTNGSARTAKWWAELADPRVTVTFDLDGMADTHSLYRIGTDWQKIIDNATAYIQAGGRAVWQMIPFDHNRHQLQDCKTLSEQLGFEGFSVIDLGRNQGPVYDRQGNFQYWIGNDDSDAPPLDAMLKNHESWYEKLDKNTVAPSCITCHAKRAKEIYLAADGSVYPCCYLGFYPQSMRHPGNDQVAPIAQNNNALIFGLEESIQWFSAVESSWQNKSAADGLLFACATSCGRN